MAAEPPKPSSKHVIPKKLTWQKEFFAFLVQACIRLFTITWRYEIHDPHGFLDLEKKQPAIYCIWHNRSAAAPGLFRHYKRKTGAETKVAVLVSASNDGALLARILSYFGISAVRGSSSRRGGQALLELNRLVSTGYDIAISPDGPRGPIYTMRPGIIALAQTTGSPILPISSEVKWKICLKSWDRFQIPLPFAKIKIFADALVPVPKEVSDEARGKLLESLRQKMVSITRD